MPCVTEAAERAYSALMKAAERIGENNRKAGVYRVQRRRGKVVQGYSITDEHRQVVEAATAVCGGKMTPNDAMTLLHDYDVMRQRLGPR